MSIRMPQITLRAKIKRRCAIKFWFLARDHRRHRAAHGVRQCGSSACARRQSEWPHGTLVCERDLVGIDGGVARDSDIEVSRAVSIQDLHGLRAAVGIGQPDRYWPAGSVTPGGVTGPLKVKTVHLSRGCAETGAASRQTNTVTAQAKPKTRVPSMIGPPYLFDDARHDRASVAEWRIG